MKTLFTFCLIPAACLGAGCAAAFAVTLFRAGYRLGQDSLGWLSDHAARCRSHFDRKKVKIPIFAPRKAPAPSWSVKP